LPLKTNSENAIAIIAAISHPNETPTNPNPNVARARDDTLLIPVLRIFWIAVCLNIPNPSISPLKNSTRFNANDADSIMIIGHLSNVVPNRMILNCELNPRRIR
jgi:hypothetical protein